MTVLRDKVALWRREYTAANGAMPLPSIHTNLPKIYTACMSMSGWGPAKKLQTWTMSLLRLQHGLRASSLAFYCPEVFAFPPRTGTYYDQDGFPQFIALKYTDWKNKKPSGK